MGRTSSLERTTMRMEIREAPLSLKCKACRGDVFSVTDLNDETPIVCDQCGAIVGRWADVRALTKIPPREVLERHHSDIFSKRYAGIAEISLMKMEA